MIIPYGMAAVSRTFELLHEGIHAGLHIGAQLFASIDSQPIADLALGLARVAADSPTHTDVPMSPDTLMLWLSAGKPITAAAIHMLMERGQISLAEPVATYIPEFAQNGKEAITLRHLLTHTAGIRALDPSYPFQSWEETLRRICEIKPERDWRPGMKAGYHTHSTWYLLGEVINRVTGTPHERWIREQVFLPLGMNNTWLAMDSAQYRKYGERIGYLYDTTAPPPSPLLNYDTELAAGRSRPSASCRGPIRELARFYEMLRSGGALGDVRLLQPESVSAMTMRQRAGLFDHTFRQTIDWGLGVILNSSHYGPGIPYQFGPYASPETFGHGGSQSSTGFCDPRNRLVVALLFNGCPGEAAHDKRLRGVLKALYEDLGLAGGAESEGKRE
jgi:CubicO group peptidase (beta-lactamase class C family)